MVRFGSLTSTPRKRSVALLIAVVAVVVGALPAAAHAPDPTLGGAPWAQDQDVRYRWRAGSVPVPEIAAAIKAAAADSNATKGARAADYLYDPAGSSLIGYGPAATCGINGIACFDRSGAPASFTMWLREHGRAFEWGTLKWCQMYDAPPNGCYDAETIALDEFGHIQLLAHHNNHADQRDYLDAVVQTYSRTKPQAGWDMHVYGRCDIATLQREYDVLSSMAPISTCLELDTVLSLRASATSATYGSPVTLTATLKVVDLAAYERLGGNHLSNRVVKLQRRAAGSTTWSTIATIPPAGPSATYAVSTNISATFEFRAVYSTPSNEGLVGDTSPTVKVTMSGCGSGSCPQVAPAPVR